MLLLIDNINLEIYNRFLIVQNCDRLVVERPRVEYKRHVSMHYSYMYVFRHGISDQRFQIPGFSQVRHICNAN